MVNVKCPVCDISSPNFFLWEEGFLVFVQIVEYEIFHCHVWLVFFHNSVLLSKT